MPTEKCCMESVRLGRKKLWIGYVFPVSFAMKQDDKSIVVESLQSGYIFLIVGVTRADFKHCKRMLDAREELNISVSNQLIMGNEIWALY